MSWSLLHVFNNYQSSITLSSNLANPIQIPINYASRKIYFLHACPTLSECQKKMKIKYRRHRTSWLNHSEWQPKQVAVFTNDVKWSWILLLSYFFFFGNKGYSIRQIWEKFSRDLWECRPSNCLICDPVFKSANWRNVDDTNQSQCGQKSAQFWSVQMDWLNITTDWAWYCILTPVHQYLTESFLLTHIVSYKFSAVCSFQSAKHDICIDVTSILEMRRSM